MELQARLGMLAAHAASLSALQWLTIISLLLCIVLVTAMSMQTRRHTQLRRELAIGGAAGPPSSQPSFDAHSLEGLGLAPIDRVFPRRPAQFLALVATVAIGAWLLGFALAPDVKHFLASPEWTFQPLYIAAHLIALRLFINVFTRNFAAGISQLDMSRLHAMRGIRAVLGPWGGMMALLIALPFCYFDFNYLYGPRYTRMGGDNVVRSADYVMWGIWSLEWFINAFIWVLLIGFMIKNCLTLRRFPFRSPIHVVLSDKQYRPFLQMSAQGATVVLGFSFVTVLYLYYTGGELTDYLGLGITVALLVFCFVPPWLVLRSKVDESVRKEIVRLRSEAGLAASARTAASGSPAGEAATMEQKFEQMTSLLKLWHLQNLYGDLGQTEAKAILFRLLAPAATIGWQVANNYTAFASRLGKLLTGAG